MERIVKLMTSRDAYDIRESASSSMSVRDLIERLEELPQDSKIVLSFNRDYIFGDIRYDSFEIEDMETYEEQEERERREEEEDWMCHDEITEVGIEINGLEGTYTCECCDGIAFCHREDAEGSVTLHYPTGVEVGNSRKRVMQVMRYRGVKRPQDITYGDIMMTFGKIVHKY
jgi:hypothetical protein